MCYFGFLFDLLKSTAAHALKLEIFKTLNGLLRGPLDIINSNSK